MVEILLALILLVLVLAFLPIVAFYSVVAVLTILQFIAGVAIIGFLIWVVTALHLWQPAIFLMVVFGLWQMWQERKEKLAAKKQEQKRLTA
jgi:hypothetical protein